MAKKSKKPHDEENQNVSPNPNSDPNSSSIFQTLFGEIPAANGATASIFSDDNPFRRKPGEGLGIDDIEVKNPELKKRKKKEKKGAVSSFDNEEEEQDEDGVKAKSKSVEPEKLDSEVRLNKNKRKRDDIEAEYEAKRYGLNEVEDAGIGSDKVGEKRKKIDNPEDLMVSKEGFDDESKLLRTIFVGNLPLKIKKKTLMKEFSKSGDIESIRIRSVPIADSKVPRKGAIHKKQLNENADCVHAYIVFKTEESAQASLAHNMAVVGGNHIRVDRACPPRKKMKGDNALLYDNKRTLFVGNLPFDVKDEEIYQLFCGIKNLETSVEAVRVVRDPNTLLGKGVAYVLFKTREAVSLVAKKHLKLRERELRISHAKGNTTPSKRKNSNDDTNASPSKKFVVDSKEKGPLSYQGMRANKSIQRKSHPKTGEKEKFKPKSPVVKKQADRVKKRPAVAARKAKALKNVAGPTRQGGTKRKMENRTPTSASRNKKPRKFA